MPAQNEVLVLLDLNPEREASLHGAGYKIHDAAKYPDRMAAIKANAGSVRAVLTSGLVGMTAAEIAALPHLGIICAIGVGYEGIDVAAAQAGGVTVTHGPGTNASSVADHALMLLLAITRDVVQADKAVREGRWATSRLQRPAVSGKKLGILGLGIIGNTIAQRAAAGFGMEVAYHSRHEVKDSPYRYYQTLKDLAGWADYLVIATPGGAATKHLVNADILQALGPEGFLVNIGRGSVVDTTALIAALKQNRIAGAGLDVVEGEPDISPELFALPNLIVTPHTAGFSPEARQATMKLVVANLDAFFTGKPVLTPVPKQA